MPLIADVAKFCKLSRIYQILSFDQLVECPGASSLTQRQSDRRTAVRVNYRISYARWCPGDARLFAQYLYRSRGYSEPQSSLMSSPLEGFDPFAVHPFTNCSVSPTSLPPAHHRHASSYAHRRVEYSAPDTQPKTYSTPTPAMRGLSAPVRPIFIPFRRDTASPELELVLKRKLPTSMSPEAGSGIKKP